MAQQRKQRVVGGRSRFDKAWCAVGTVAVRPSQHQTMQMDVEVGSRAEALNQREGAARPAKDCRSVACTMGSRWGEPARSQAVHRVSIATRAASRRVPPAAGPPVRECEGARPAASGRRVHNSECRDRVVESQPAASLGRRRCDTQATFVESVTAMGRIAAARSVRPKSRGRPSAAVRANLEKSGLLWRRRSALRRRVRITRRPNSVTSEYS